MSNLILHTDSYKLTHYKQYDPQSEVVYSYFESRKGARFPYTTFFGLQYILKQYLEGRRITTSDVEEAYMLCKAHFGNKDIFNYEGWMHIVKEHHGKLPVRIKAVPEGTCVPVSNVLMTVENTDPKCYWLTNALESILTHVWYPSTVATLSREVKCMIAEYMKKTCDTLDMLPFKLHDFGYRGVSSDESAKLGGAAHLVNFMGTDTVPAIMFLTDYYQADMAKIAYSVPATEHSVMTAYGKDGEKDVVERVLKLYPTGIVSVVADSYNIYDFVQHIVGEIFKEQILKRDGIFVVRPDSLTPDHETPAKEMVWILESLWNSYGGTTNTKGYRVLDSHVRVLWGDGLEFDAIHDILEAVIRAGFSVDNIATFGMGGGLLQKVNRDTQRFAFKSSAQKRNGEWYDIYKQPCDISKTSKKGRLGLYSIDGKMVTRNIGNNNGSDLLIPVFEDGQILQSYTLDEIRENAKI